MNINLEKIENEKFIIWLLNRQGVILKKAPVGEPWKIATYDFENHPTPASMFTQANNIIFKENLAPLKIDEIFRRLMWEDAKND